MIKRTRSTGTPDFICFAAQDWWYHNQAHSDFQLMRSLAEDHRVLVINSLGLRMPAPGRSTHPARRVARKLGSVARLMRTPVPDLPNFHVLSPVALPVYGDSPLARVNARLIAAQVRLACRRLAIDKPVAVVTLPTAEPVLDYLELAAVVANRSDKHSNFAEADSALIAEHEARLIRRADHVLYASHALMEEERSLSGGKSYFLDHGVDSDHFVKSDRASEPEDLRSIPSPRAGFFGAVDDLVDVDLLAAVAERLPDVQIVLIGEVTTDVSALTGRPNVHILGRRPYADIPKYGSGFDVALMPWQDNEWIRLCNPIKLKEYLALGLPVVSTPFPELVHYGDLLRVAGGRDGFVAEVDAALHESDESAQLKRRDSVAGITWRSLAGELTAICEGRSAAIRR